MSDTKKAVAIVSGGLDSITLAYDLRSKDFDLTLLSFDYGQRHKKELTFAKLAAKALDVKHHVVDLTGLTHLISNSALTSLKGHEGTSYEGTPMIEVPEGHYAEDNMKATVVPNRNMIMLAIAGGVAVNEQAGCVATAVHGGDHFIYPDCRPGFVSALALAMNRGNEGFGDLYEDHMGSYVLGEVDKNRNGTNNGFYGSIYAPYIYKTKADIAYRAMELAVPLHMTWSCYKGWDKHCGKCGTCVERLEAIDEAQARHREEGQLGSFRMTDNTEYQDTEFWKVTIAGGVKES